eukprot:2395268-Rhodomonas_salina.1
MEGRERSSATCSWTSSDASHVPLYDCHACNTAVALQWWRALPAAIEHQLTRAASANRLLGTVQDDHGVSGPGHDFRAHRQRDHHDYHQPPRLLLDHLHAPRRDLGAVYPEHVSPPTTDTVACFRVLSLLRGLDADKEGWGQGFIPEIVFSRLHQFLM